MTETEPLTTKLAVCRRHGRTAFALRGDGYFRCRKCSSEAVRRWRRNAKLRLIEAAGGACVLCGYDRFSGALEFHHVEPSTKSFGLATRGLTRSFAKLEAEAAKCVLLCGNCHAEVEGGHRTLPPEMAPLKLNGDSEQAA